MSTMTSLVSRVITALRQVPGVSTQTYSASIIQQYIDDSRNLLIDEAWWPELMYFFTPTLTGTTGLLTADLTGPIGNITRFGDIAYVFPSGYNSPLLALPQRSNPYLLTGTSPLYISGDQTFANRPLKVWPIESIGSLVVWARQRPATPAALTDEMYIDDLLLVYCAAWQYATDDGTTPAMVDKFFGLYQLRKKQLLENLSKQSIPLSNSSSINTQWFEAP